VAPVKLKLVPLLITLLTVVLVPVAGAGAQSAPWPKQLEAASSESDGCSSSQEPASGGTPLGLSFEQGTGVQVPLGAPATVRALALLAPVLKIGNEVSFAVTSGPDADNLSDHGQARAVDHPDASSLPCVPAADFNFTHYGTKPGTDTVTASITVNGHTLTATTTVTWVKPLDCAEPWPETIGYLNALDCVARKAAGSALARNIFEGVTCALSVAAFFIPAAKAATIFDGLKDVSEGPAVAQLVIHLTDLQRLTDGAVGAKAFFLELANAASVPAFLHDVADLVKTVSANHQSATVIVEQVATDITDLLGLTPCVDLLEKIVTKIVGTSVTTSPGGAWNWHPAAMIDPNDGFSAVSCGTPTFCAVVSGASAATYNGRIVTRARKIDANNQLLSVSCVRGNFCAAVDLRNGMGAALTLNGTSWDQPVIIDRQEQMQSVSCVSASFCVAIAVGYGVQGDVLIYNGKVWELQAKINDATTTSISCSSETFCVALDAEGDAFIYNGTSWSQPTTIDQGGLFDREVSCATRRLCLAVDGSGAAALYNGTSWNHAATAGTSGVSVSCASDEFCRSKRRW
jgi:hypothetical protein